MAAKDLRIELRSRDLLATMVFFSLVAVALLRFAFDFVPSGEAASREEVFRGLGSGVLWTTFVFAAILGLDRSFSVEKEEGGLDGLRLAPVDRSALLLGKTAAALVLVGAMETVVVTATSVLFDVNFLPIVGPLAAVLAVNTFGFVLVGTVVSFLCGGTRRGQLLLPVLQIPLTLPLLLFAVRATAHLLQGREGQAWEALRFSGVVTAVYLGACLVVFDWVVEE